MEYQLELKQIVDYPRCRIYREFVRRLMNDPNFRTYITISSCAPTPTSVHPTGKWTELPTWCLQANGSAHHRNCHPGSEPDSSTRPSAFWTFCSPRITSPIPAWTGTGSSNFIYLIGKPIILLLSTTTHARRMLAFSFSRYRLFMNW